MQNLKIIGLFLSLILLTRQQLQTEASASPIKQLPSEKGKSSSDALHYQTNQQYVLKLKPKQSVIIALNTTLIKGYLFMDYISTYPFHICQLSQERICQKQKKHHKSHEGVVEFDSPAISNGIQIINQHQSIYIKLTIRFYEQKDSCFPLAAKTLYRKPMQQSLCFVHAIQSEKSCDLLVKLEELAQITFEISICGMPFGQKELSQNRIKISNWQISQRCTGKAQQQLRVLVKRSVYLSSLFLTLVLEYEGETILVPDGVGYLVQLRPETPQIVSYELLDSGDTTVFVQSRCAVQIFAKIVGEELAEDTVPSSDDYHFSSKAGIFFTYYKHSLHIASKEIKARSCDGCYLIVAVYLSSGHSNTSEATIEITQHYSLVSMRVPIHNYLQKGSIAYYTFSSPKTERIYVQIADNNQYCARVFLSDAETPSEENYLHKYDRKQMIFEALGETVYYIAVEAKQSCAYSLVFYDSTHNITYLEKGRFGMLTLAAGQSKVFLVQSEDSQYLKFISLHIYGQVSIYLNRTTLKQVNSIYTSLNLSAFERKSDLQNRLLVDQGDEIFCRRCYYLVGVLADKNTQSTFFYGDEQTPIPIRDKKLHDVIGRKDQIVKAEYYGSDRSSYRLRVHSGRLLLKVYNQKNSYVQNFPANEEPYQGSFDLEIKKEDIFSQLVHLIMDAPLKVELQALQDNTIYSLLLAEQGLPSEEASRQYKNVSIAPGEVEFERVGTGRTLCLSGFLRGWSERVILTCSYAKRRDLQLLVINAQINSMKFETKIEQVQNIVSICFPSLKHFDLTTSARFEIYISANGTDVDLSILQQDDFSLLPAETQVSVLKQFTFVTHIESDIIIDIFSCDGSFSLAYGPSTKTTQLPRESAFFREGINGQQHAVHLKTYSTTFFKVTAQRAILRWFPMDTERGIGTGYIDYQVGHLMYESSWHGLTLSWSSLKNVKGTTGIVHRIQYSLFASRREQSLKTASQCESTQNIILHKANCVKEQQTNLLNYTHILTLGEDQLAPIIPQGKLFLTIVADLQILPNTSQASAQQGLERYRFTYPIVFIPPEVMASLRSQTLPVLTIPQMVTLSMIFLLALTFLAYLCLRKILPLLGIIKNRMLVEEGDEIVAGTAEKFTLPVPLSSDRNHISKGSSEEKEDYVVPQ